MNRTTFLMSVTALGSALGCGGIESASKGPGSEASIGDASGTDVDVGSDAGSPDSSDAEVPLNHRPKPADCPSQRGPGPPGQPYYVQGVAPIPPVDAGGCSSDSDCKSGVNGRCFPNEWGGSSGCSYDECFTDSECPAGATCLCRSSSTDNTANACVPPGNCTVDSDCGPGGYCSPSWETCNRPTPYYCHTKRDTCITDSDCYVVDASECYIAQAPPCEYDPQAQRWQCALHCCGLP